MERRQSGGKELFLTLGTLDHFMHLRHFRTLPERSEGYVLLVTNLTKKFPDLSGLLHDSLKPRPSPEDPALDRTGREIEELRYLPVV